jgi:hypothetical protein
MRYLAFLLVASAMIFLSPRAVLARIEQIDMGNQSYAAGGSRHHFKLCHRGGPSYVAAPMMANVETLTIPCPPAGYGSPGGHRSLCYQYLDAMKRRIHHIPPHCAYCYPGNECTCCSHDYPTIKRSTPRYVVYKSLIRLHLIDTF